MRNIALQLLALLAAALMLAACGTGPRPFDKASSPSGKTPPAILLAPLAGVPADKAKILADDLADTASSRDIAIVQGDMQDVWTLTGNFQAVLEGTTSVVHYAWSLSDDKGRTIHSFTGREAGRTAVGDAWSGIDPDVMRRIASTTSESLAARLSQLGYATRSAAIIPPINTFVEAGPNAENEIDLETWFGPNAYPAADRMPPTATGQVADVAPEAAPAPSTAEQPGERAAAPAPAEQQPQPQKPQRTASKGPEIRAVAVTRVSGSDGPGKGELLAAMRQVLTDAGWPVITERRADALEITGDLGVSKPVAGQQTVVLNWKVLTPEGHELGNIRQSNKIPAGSLDNGWGPNARAAAEAAARGIFNLVEKARTAG